MSGVWVGAMVEMRLRYLALTDMAAPAALNSILLFQVKCRHIQSLISGACVMTGIALFIIWTISFISSIGCAAIGFVGTGMSGDSTTFLPTLMLASPIFVIIAGILELRAQSFAAVLFLNIMLMTPIVPAFPLLGAVTTDLVNLLLIHKSTNAVPPPSQ